MASQKKKAGAKPKRKPKPRVTEVLDRVEGVPLGREAQHVAALLRSFGSDPSLVPDLRADAARVAFLSERARPLRRSLPMWVLDLAAAVLAQIPLRAEARRKRRGRPRDPDTEEVEFWQLGGGTTAEAARLVATLRARRQGQDDDHAEAERLARRLYRKPKAKRRDVP